MPDTNDEAELKTTQANQTREYEDLEQRQGSAFTIKIDRREYEVHERELTGRQLRHLPNPLIGPDRDLFEVVPGGSDRKITDDMEVKMRDGLRFFTAPAQINPGAV